MRPKNSACLASRNLTEPLCTKKVQGGKFATLDLYLKLLCSHLFPGQRVLYGQLLKFKMGQVGRPCPIKVPCGQGTL